MLCGLDRETWIIFERVFIHVKIGIKDSSVFSLEISFVVLLFRLVFEREKKKRKSEEIAIARFSSTTILNVNNANKMGLKWERNLLVGGSVNWRRMQVF